MLPQKHVSQIIKRRKIEISKRVRKSTYGKIADKLDVSKGLLWKFVNTDYVPTSPELLRKLDLPEPILIYRTRNPQGQFEPYD